MKEGIHSRSFYSHGKLLITAEYLVLDGAKALAIPTKKGQWLEVDQNPLNEAAILWKSLDEKGQNWLEVSFDHELNILQSTLEIEAEALQQLLRKARDLNPSFISKEYSYEVVSKLEFPANWGLGSSSTLVNNIAQWSQTDPFQLQFEVFGGSGYDVACAFNEGPIIYALISGEPNIESVTFSPAFKDQIFFVHLGEKQNSRKEIDRYRAQKQPNENDLISVSELTTQIVDCDNPDSFEQLLNQHEQSISAAIGLKTMKEQRFLDYPGVIKSLGAWGGDFILTLGGEKERKYFRDKGYVTILEYSDLLL